jgi:hypothetical protein
MELYHQTRGDGWDWFEDHVTYNNATLPHALLLTSRWLDRADMAQAGLESLEWLVDIQTDPEGIFTPVGSQGFFPRGGEKAALINNRLIQQWFQMASSQITQKFPGTGKDRAFRCSGRNGLDVAIRCGYGGVL